jgi:hypothetical protein
MDIYDTILTTGITAQARIGLRQESRKARAAAIRSLFKRLGLKGISVTAPNYSMAQSVDITFPVRHCTNEVHQDYSKNLTDCADCTRVQEAKHHLETIILGAYPDLDESW